MKRLTLSLALLVFGFSLSACGSYNTPTAPTGTSPTKFTAILLPANEVPAIVGAEAAGSGTATITLNLTKDAYGSVTAATVDFAVTATGFPNGTVLTGAHIHPGSPGINGAVLISTGLAPGEVVLANGGGSFTKSGIAITVDQANTIMANPSSFYFNIHTVDNPNGVARGQLTLAQ
jgi:hypothetical protein